MCHVVGSNFTDLTKISNSIDPGSLHDVREVHDAYSHRPVLLKDQFLDSDDIHLASSPALWQGVYTEAHRERSRTAEDVRAVVEEYCASKHGCKQLVISREYYGWDWTALKAGIEASIQANLYAGQVYVEFDNEPTTITVRAPGWSSRMLATSWGYKVPLSLVLMCVLRQCARRNRVPYAEMFSPLQLSVGTPCCVHCALCHQAANCCSTRSLAHRSFPYHG